MQITFTRTGARTYTTVVVRNDGVTLQVPSFDRPTWIPHDLAHYVVERTLGLRRGFWGCVAAGAVFPGMAVISGRQRPHAATRSRTIIRDAGQQGTEVEVLVDLCMEIAQQKEDTDRMTIHARLADAWQPHHPVRESLHTHEVQQACAVLREFQQQWHALPIGRHITVTWPEEQLAER